MLNTRSIHIKAPPGILRQSKSAFEIVRTCCCEAEGQQREYCDNVSPPHAEVIAETGNLRQRVQSNVCLDTCPNDARQYECLSSETVLRKTTFSTFHALIVLKVCIGRVSGLPVYSKVTTHHAQ